MKNLVTQVLSAVRFDPDASGLNPAGRSLVGNRLKALRWDGTLWLLLTMVTLTAAQNGTVNSHQKISDTEGNFIGVLDDSDIFGSSVAALGDLDGDGVSDLAAGAQFDDDGGSARGAVWVLFLNDDGTVKSHQKDQ